MSESPRWRWLPPAGSWRYHALLALVGIFVLGPLGAFFMYKSIAPYRHLFRKLRDEELARATPI